MARLSASLAADTLAIAFAGETMSRRIEQPYARADVARLAETIIELLARGNRGRALVDKHLDDLRHAGERLWRTLVPAALRDDLLRADSLVLELDEALAAIPWELCHDGAAFLCRRVALGRQLRSLKARRGDERRAVGTPARVLIMAADARGDLPEVQKEGAAILDALEPHARVRPRLSTAPDRAFALRYLKDYDLVHFCGHADFVAGAPGQSGWQLSDGKLSADEIEALAGGRPMPMIVFSNACQSSHAKGAEVLGLANAFLVSGVRCYIGTQWEIADGHSAIFAAAFYRHLVAGKSIGAAVRHARSAVVEGAGESALAWASYVLYGDPDLRPLVRAEEQQKLSIPSARRIAARASAPWKRPPATGAAERRAGDRRALPSWIVGAIIGAAVGLAAVAALAWTLLGR